MTQKYESLKYEKTIAPRAAAWAAITGFTLAVARMGAVMEALVIIATVPEPCTRRTNVATRKGRSTGGMHHAEADDDADRPERAAEAGGDGVDYGWRRHAADDAGERRRDDEGEEGVDLGLEDQENEDHHPDPEADEHLRTGDDGWRACSHDRVSPRGKGEDRRQLDRLDHGLGIGLALAGLVEGGAVVH
jgi:hypothetical protein